MAQLRPVDYDPFGEAPQTGAKLTPVEDDPFAPKERSWSAVPGEALRNAPGSAARLGGAILEAVTSPVQTVKGLGEVVAGGARNAAQAVLPESAFNYLTSFENPERMAEVDAKADAVGQFYKDRYGSVEGIKNTLATDPVGAAADAATVLYGGGALTPGRAGAAIQKAGSVVDPIANTGRAVSKTASFAGNRVADILGTTTGAGSLPIRTAFEAGQEGSTAFRDQMRGVAPMDEVVNMAERGVDAIVKKRGADYQANNPLGKPGARTPEAMQPLDTKPIWDKITEGSGMSRFQGVTYNEKAAKVTQELNDLMTAFEKAPDGRSAVGLDKLKQGVYDIARDYPPGTAANKIAMGVYKEIGGQIRKQVPAYDNLMKDYSQASELINEMRRTLSINDKATTDTTMRKLQSVMRNNVNTNYGQRQKLVDALAKVEPDLPKALAGQALNDYAPRGLSRIAAGGAGVAGLATMNPSTLAMLPLASPRIIGEAAFGSGRFAKSIESAAKKSGMTPDKLARLLIALQATGNVSQAGEQ